jgi:predicted phage terminase large subunit-like protein
VKEEAESLSQSLTRFTQGAWPQLERKKYLHNWHIDALAEHLEAVAKRQLKRLIINVPFRTMKSTLVNVAFPAWTWTHQPGHQFLCGSHAEKLAIRDNLKHRRLVASPWYRERWGEKFSLSADQNQKLRFENDQGGYRIAFGMTSGITGDGGDTVIIDDPHDRDSAQSEKERETALETFDQSVITRLNDPDDSAIVVIMQRLHENDLSGHLLAGSGDDWEHLMLPMEYDPARHCVTSIGFSDPRGSDEDGNPLSVAEREEHAGELLWKERFSPETVASLSTTLGPYGTSGQLQQMPTPAGGGLIKRQYWEMWDADAAANMGVKVSEDGTPQYPPFEFVVASADTAYTEKEENDPTGFTIWGVFRDRNEMPRVMLIWAWAKHCELHGKVQDRLPSENKRDFDRRSMKTWGLVEWIAYSCRRFRVDKLLIEAKASGITVAQEMKRLYKEDGWSIELVKPVGDKVARAHAVEPSFAAGLIYAPDMEWAEKVIAECETFPKGTHDDLVDSTTQALQHLRQVGLIAHNFEVSAELREAMQHRPQSKALYDV